MTDRDTMPIEANLPKGIKPLSAPLRRRNPQLAQPAGRISPRVGQSFTAKAVRERLWRVGACQAPIGTYDYRGMPSSNCGRRTSRKLLAFHRADAHPLRDECCARRKYKRTPETPLPHTGLPLGCTSP